MFGKERMTNQIQLPFCDIGKSITIEHKTEEQLIVVSYMTGVKKIEPVKYYVVAKTIKYKWLFWWYEKTEWYIDTEFATLSGFETKEDACMAVLQMGQRPYFK
jgi:hypothetical protein